MRDWRAYVRARLPRVATRAEREAEIVEELALQLEAAYDAARARGASAAEAERHAESEVPDWSALARTFARIEAPPPPDLVAQRGAMLSGFSQDLRRALRMLAHAPAYAAVAIVTLSVGLGLGGAAFSLVDRVLIRPLPYPGADRLVILKATVPPDGRPTVEITYPDAQDVASAAVFESTAALMPYAATTTNTDPPTRIEGFEVSPAWFSTLGVIPALGRTFTPADGEPASAPVAIIGHGLWERLGSPADIVGRPLMLNDVPRTIVGVVPRDYRVDLLPHPADVFIPLTRAHMFAANRAVRAFRVVARMKDGASVEQASAAVAAIGAQLAQAYPETNRDRTFFVEPLQQEVVGPVRSQVWLVAGLVALVLLVGGVNFAGLLLTRTAGRLREVSVQLALGASRWRIVRQSIAEGLLLAVAGAALGVVVAAGALDLVRAAPGLTIPRLAEVTLDARAIAGVIAAAVALACAVGLAPLLLVRHAAATGSLRAGHETASRPALRMRGALIVGQTALAFVLVAAAVLLASSLRALLAQPLGFETDAVVTLRIAVPETRYATRDDTTRFYTELVDELRQHASVQSAGVISNLPLAGNTGSTLSIQGRDTVPLALRPTIGWHWTSPGYFAAMGMRIVRGRDFAPEDVARAPHVTVINETLARLHFGGEDPIGKRVYFGGFGPGGPPEWHEVIGIVSDVRHRQLDAEPDARAYDLFGQHWGRTVSLAVRTAGSPLQTATLVRQLLARRDPRLAVFAVRTTADLVSAAVGTRRLLLWLVSIFAAIGVGMAVIGLYGTLSYMVAQRTREVGVRVALGATRFEIRRLVVGRGLRLTATGLAVGLVLAWTLRRAIEAQLFGVMATNVPALAIAALALVAAAFVACLAPAARALRVNPVDALRAE
jgi:predicted permease